MVTCDALDKAQHTIKDLEAKNQDLASENAALKEKLRLASHDFGESSERAAASESQAPELLSAEQKTWV